ncbi:MAG: hypothetical protein ACI4JJ_05990 [Huintestinicola sp.]
MNMKKSIAGVMAGAMAVSAMAATVSADQESIALNYDLCTYVPEVTKASITIVEKYASTQLTRVSDTVGDELNASGESEIVFGVINPWIQGDAASDIDSGAMKTFEFTAVSRSDISVQDAKQYTNTIKYTDTKTDTDAVYTSALGGTTFAMPVTTNATAGKFPMNKYKDTELGYTLGVDAETGVVVEDNDYTFQGATATMKYEIDGEYLSKKGSAGTIDASLIIKYGLQYGYSLTKSDVVVSEGFAKVADTRTLVGAPTFSVSNFVEGAYGEAVYPFRTVLNPKNIYLLSGVGSTTALTTTNSVGTLANIGLDYDGWTLTSNGNYFGYYLHKDNDVIGALTSRKTNGNRYTKPVAVINDAIANHENVVFTFTSFSGYVTTEESAIYEGWSTDFWNGAEIDTWRTEGYDTWVSPYRAYGYQINKYDWYNPSFGQHLYTNLSDSYSLFDSDEFDGYGSYSSAWGVNLFTSALVVNNAITMQLSDTDKFDWNTNTVSFDWNSITADGKVTDAKTLLNSMLLYTPVEWYWEYLSVVVGDDAEEDVAAGEGMEGEGDEIADDEIVDEEPADEVVEPEEVVEPVKEEEKPAPTGNAPVALAVIPVALAAAAIVAKKRG